MQEEYDDDFIDGLDLTVPLEESAVCHGCGMEFRAPKPFVPGVHVYCRECHKKLQEKQEKPPIGLMRKSIHDHLRALSTLAAIRRYVDDGKEVPSAWLEELRSLPDTGEAGFFELESSIRSYNTGGCLKKVGIRVVRFKEKEDSAM